MRRIVIGLRPILTSTLIAATLLIAASPIRHVTANTLGDGSGDACPRLAGDAVSATDTAYWNAAASACEQYRRSKPQSADALYLALKARYMLRDYTSVPALRQLANDRNHAPSMVLLGKGAMVGLGAPMDRVVAMRWFYRARQLGSADAECFIGEMYLHGWGVAQDIVTARKHFETAATEGSVEGALAMAYTSRFGIGTGIDHVAALKWYRKAAEAGSQLGMLRVANAYVRGEGVTKDRARARRIYQRLIARNSTDAMLELANSLKEARPNDPPAQSRELIQRAADLGNSNAFRRIGTRYFLGTGVAKDNAKARDYFQRALELGNLNAYEDMGKAYQR